MSVTYSTADGITTATFTYVSGETILSGATAQLNGATVAIIEGYSSIDDQAFQDASGLTSIEIPASVTSIGSSAFRSALGLTSINIPTSVTSIGDWAFAYTGLTSVPFEDISNSQLTIIGKNAFYKATSLTFITIPAGVTTIKINAFRATAQLRTI